MEEPKFKYTLIVSQYYHTRHNFIVEHESETFLEKAKAFATELESYKRGEDCKREIDLGDLTYHKDDTIHRRYNINDSGDIYFLNSEKLSGLIREANEYREECRRQSNGFKKRSILESIDKHHDFRTVRKILEKYFVIA